MASKSEEKWEQQLNSCLDEIRRVCGSRLADDALTLMREYSEPLFKAQEELWDACSKKVLRACSFIGIIAVECAALDESATITKEHIWAAIAAVRRICRAGLPTNLKGGWCPDPPPGL
jgi:hypothetical protein